MHAPESRRVAGLTGGAGCGKSVVAALFAELGARVVDADRISHELTGPGGAAMDAIVEAFGPSSATPSGALDRAWMRATVLADAGARRMLEGLLHPLIRARMAEAIQQGPPDALYIVEIPLLFETLAYRDWMRWTVAVDCPVGVQRRRLKARSALPDAEIDGLLAAQVPRAVRLQLAESVLSNVGDVASLRPAVAALFQRWAGTSWADL